MRVLQCYTACKNNSAQGKEEKRGIVRIIAWVVRRAYARPVVTWKRRVEDQRQAMTSFRLASFAGGESWPSAMMTLIFCKPRQPELVSTRPPSKFSRTTFEPACPPKFPTCNQKSRIELATLHRWPFLYKLQVACRTGTPDAVAAVS